MQTQAHPIPAAGATLSGHLRIPRAKLKALFPAGLPADTHGLILEGDSLAPMARDGDMALASPSTAAQPGELVVLWPIVGASIIRRLLVTPMPMSPDAAAISEVTPAVLLGTLTPSRTFCLSMARVAAMHGVVGLLKPGQYLRGVRSTGRAA